ncbi:Asp-tRNA(Asn)/Glu-tRNA(Gln) amidotransferase subunit GatC [bacterium]|jgi:aspartyl-tRNA(Asn)/glutamyl-tRNA(Gln) amidotransferase subunit C|nr:Asp-tRNA(Asn)/Glu-tRNA(Gln) amidotransferase subunit GatC [bacterium]MBT6832196.1 Asp-tRNA(Asn)/Glu-tRNA(Gln) amidotransferase subunit GatC [bacterium]MBT6996141.1 Asp-tRNA(Asn)/Glu-tRNA(Gln) amidotransferase subunit GatC [bacterium]MBT7772221.1 Asp-tRNA(Asn)/Glu-tRNA(Gln) amidotransferase subunit GatC [bacterium]
MSKKISTDDVLHLAKLAKLHLTPNEAEKFSGQLSDILKFIAQLQSVDTRNVEETSQVTGLRNVSRADEIEMCGFEKELVECTPHAVEKNCLKIPKIL